MNKIKHFTQRNAVVIFKFNKLLWELFSAIEVKSNIILGKTFKWEILLWKLTKKNKTEEIKWIKKQN